MDGGSRTFEENTFGAKRLLPSLGRGRGWGGKTMAAAVIRQKGPAGFLQSDLRRTAAAYSPTWWGSTIGDGGLNFSVRNGKRWYPAAIATAICYLREITHAVRQSEHAFFVCFPFCISS